MSGLDAFPEGEMLPDGVSLLTRPQRAEVASRRAAPPSNAMEALMRATLPAEGDPPVPLVAGTPAGRDVAADEPLPAHLSLLTAAQRADVAIRSGGGAA